MSRSFVTVGEPSSRPPNPPMMTNRTPSRFSVRSARSGSNGRGSVRPGDDRLGAIDRPLGSRRAEDAGEVPGLSNGQPGPLPGRELQQLADHGAVESGAQAGERPQRLTAPREEPIEGVDPGNDAAGLHASDHRLWDVGPLGERPLSQAGADSRFSKHPPGVHDIMIALSLSESTPRG